MINDLWERNIDMSHTFKRIFLYIGTIFVGLFYIYVLYLGVNPDVSIEYQKYFIEQELTHWPGDGGLSLNLGEEYNMYPSKEGEFDYYKGLGDGWGEMTEKGWYTQDGISELMFTNLSKDKDEYIISFKINDMPNETIMRVLINDIEIERINNDTNIWQYRIRYDQLKEYNKLTLISSHEFQLNSFVIE